uniref:Uncharacterized protein n=1 Tax=Strigamia maritima TaxID=126957 RepID=T1JPJ3_STRMM
MISGRQGHVQRQILPDQDSSGMTTMYTSLPGCHTFNFEGLDCGTSELGINDFNYMNQIDTAGYQIPYIIEADNNQPTAAAP